MNKKYLIILTVVLGILFFITGKDNSVFATRVDYYVCGGYCSGLTGPGYAHYWCDDGGWCSVCDNLQCGTTVAYCTACSVSCGGGTQTCGQVDSHCGIGAGWCSATNSQACNTQACCTGVPINCTAWSSCSGTCTGTQTRTCYDQGCGSAIPQTQMCTPSGPVCHIYIQALQFLGIQIIK